MEDSELVAHPEWLSTRQQLYRQVKQQVEMLLGPPSVEMKSYSDNYESEFQGRWRHSSIRELLNEIVKSDIVYGGDFHAFLQSQKTHIRILRSLPKNRKIVLALECLEEKNEGDVKSFLQGKISEETLVQRLKWEERWGFPWEHYRAFFHLAKKNDYKIVGLNQDLNPGKTFTLKSKDRFAAKKILSELKEIDDGLVYVIFGEWHLSREHIPKLVDSKMPNLNDIIVYQNSERLYFKLARQDMESQVHVMKGAGPKWCVLGAPPWVQWQSYLMFLQQMFDEGLEDEEFYESDFTDYICQQIHFLSKDLNIKTMKADNIEVYSSHDDQVWESLSQRLSKKEFKMALYHIKNDRSFLLPASGTIYLSRNSINHMVELAGEYIQAKLSQRQKVLWDYPDQFVAKIWVEALGFFSSKLVNHKRKAENLQNLKAQLAVAHPRDNGREALLLSLDQRLCEILVLSGHTDVKRKFKPKNKETYLEASRILGSMLGEKLYLAYRSQRIKRKDVIQFFKLDASSKDFEKQYLKTVESLEDIVNPDGLGGVIYG